MWTNITDDEIAKADDDTTATGEDMTIPPVLGKSSNMLEEKIKSTDSDFDEEAHPRDENGRFSCTESEKDVIIESKFGRVRPQGKNTLKHRGFRDKQHLKNHLSKRQKNGMYLDCTPEQYQEKAIALLESETSDSILGHVDRDGFIVRYDVKANDFVKGSIARGIKTMYKPDDGADYYFSQREEDIKRGGKL